MSTVEKRAARWGTILRVTAATLGAYGVTSLALAALSRALIRLGTDPVEAVISLTLASFIVFAAIAIASFHGRNPVRTWAWLIGSALVLGAIGWISAPVAA